jgi:hypothetical protein
MDLQNNSTQFGEERTALAKLIKRGHYNVAKKLADSLVERGLLTALVCSSCYDEFRRLDHQAQVRTAEVFEHYNFEGWISRNKRPNI